MTTKFALSNFKGFKELDAIEMKPLTVLCGINSSGKSSIIQSLLLMKQSNIDSSQLSIDSYIQEPVVFNGLYVRLGDWADVINNHATEKEIGFFWKLSGDFDLRDKTRYWNTRQSVQIDVEVEIKLSNLENETMNSSENKNKLLVNSFVFRDIERNFSWEIIQSGEGKYLIKLKYVELKDLLFRWIDYGLFDIFSTYQRNRLDTRKFTETKFFKETVIEEVVFDNVQVKFEGILPTLLTINDFTKQSYTNLNKVNNDFTNSRTKIPKHLSKFIDTTLRNLSTYLQKKPAPEKKADIQKIPATLLGDEFSLFRQEKEFELMYYYGSYQVTATYLRNLWSSVRYIGPLREAPKRFYFFEDLRKIDIGINGEYTPLVLAIEQEHKIPKYYRCIYQGKQIKEYELRESDKMLEAVNWWLSECMKLPNITSVVGLGGIPGQVKLNSSGIEVHLPDVGFGVSQILPILVECLRTKPEETIVLEQPEIHLHPSLQSKLADFFICMAKSGKKLVIETHSEHLINRLCLRIAQEESGEIKELLNTLFVSFDEKQKTSVVKPIQINEFGEIQNWPVGFFDENDARDLMEATLKKRMAKFR
jgi:predicted ATPase